MSSMINSIFGIGEKKKVINLSSDDFEKLIKEDENAVILDVRTQMEHSEQRIPNSQLIDLMNPMFLTELDQLDKNKNYYLYCRSGNRSYYAGQEMIKKGFEKVSHLASGIIGWYGETESDRG